MNRLVQLASRIIALLPLAGLIMGLMHSAELTAQDKLEPLERICIRRGEKEAQFFLKDSNVSFFVTGFNYIRLRATEGESGGDHATFDADTTGIRPMTGK